MVAIEKIRQTVTPEEIEATKEALTKNILDIEMNIQRRPGKEQEAGIGMFFRPGQLKAVGISYDQLRRLVATGVVERVARGLYRLRAAEPTENHSMAAVCASDASADS